MILLNQALNSLKPLLSKGNNIFTFTNKDGK